MSSEAHAQELKRTLGFWTLLVYGIGDILGAGIYALVGEIARIAGPLTWVSFLIALAAAALTALSYAELSARFPHSGGAANFCQQAFRSDAPAVLVGWLIFCSGVLSMAVLSRAFAGYFGEILPDVPDWALVLSFLTALAWVNFRGIEFSTTANMVCTAVEVLGLAVVIAAGLSFVFTDPMTQAAPTPPQPTPSAPGVWSILQAGALAFYAYIGFEDLVNLAGEAREPRRDLPRALLGALGCAGVIYLAVVAACLAVLSPEELGRSQAPLLDVVRRAAPAVPVWLFAVIPLFAVANSALVNSVMASRLLYGMSQERLLPAWLARVHPRRRTPYAAVIFVSAVAAGLALSGTLARLAGTTSVLLLIAFLMVHVALARVQRGPEPSPGFAVPGVVPIIGAVSVGCLAVFVPPSSLPAAAVMLALGLVLVAVHHLVCRRRA
jgi:amino acid transporter